MAVVFLDGMECLSGNSIPKKYMRVEAYNSSFLGTNTAGRYGTNCYYGATLGGANQRHLISFTAVSMVILGMYTSHDGTSTTAFRRMLIVRGPNSAEILTLGVCATTYVLYGASALGLGTSLISAGTVMTLNTWNHHEMRVRWSGGAAVQAEIYLSGAHIMSYTGSITSGTQTSGVSSIGEAGWGTITTGVTNCKYDDFYVLDDQGTIATSLVGSTARIRVHKVSGDSTPLSWSTTSTAHYTEVDDPNQISNTDYISAQSAGQQDTFTITQANGYYSQLEIPKGGQVTVTAYGSGTVSLHINALLGGNVVSAAHTAPASWSLYRLMLASAPGLGSWVISNVTNLQVGVEMQT